MAGHTPEARDNAARIVACVNACAGIADPETTIPALIAALRAVQEHCRLNDAPSSYYGRGQRAVAGDVRAVLAQVGP